MEITKTKHGFDLIKFKDRYLERCSLEKSSLADEDAIWLGSDEDQQVHPVFGTKLSTRMCLNQEQVQELLPFLQRFADTGEIICESDLTEEKIIDGYNNVCCSPITISFSQFLTLSKMLGFLEGTLLDLKNLSESKGLLNEGNIGYCLALRYHSMKSGLKDELESIVMDLREQYGTREERRPAEVKKNEEN